MKPLCALLALLMVVMLVISVGGCARTSLVASETSEGFALVATPEPVGVVRQSGGLFACGIDPYNALFKPHPEHFLHWVNGGFVFDNVAMEPVPLTDHPWGYAEVTSVGMLMSDSGEYLKVVDVNPDHWDEFPFYADVLPTDYSIVYTSCEFLHDGWELENDWYNRNDTEIAVVEISGDSRGNRKRLTDNNADEYFPVWSPNGEQIAFISHPSYLTSNQEDYWMTIMDIGDGSEVRINKAFLHPPSWSPDGENVAFIRGPNDYYWRDYVGYGAVQIDLFTVRSNGFEEPQKLASSSSWEFAFASRLMSFPFGGPSWSPDGNWIAFGSSSKDRDSREGNAKISIIRSNGTMEKTVWAGRSSFPVTQVSWSPNGEEILFIATDVFVVRPDGTGLRRVDSFVRPRARWPAYESPRVAQAAWSQDSSQIALYDGRDTVVTVNRDGTGARIYQTPCWRCTYGS